LINPLLSIIFPAHNEELRLSSALEKCVEFLSTCKVDGDIWVVENGSSDRTLQIANEYAQKYPFIHVIHEDGRGKGLAVKRGMLAADGDYRIACDVDLSMPVDEIVRFIPPMLTTDIAIASREVHGAVRFNEPQYRHFIGRIFNLLVRILALPGLQDSQCGFKCFSRKAAEELFPLMTIQGWTFDVEVLFAGLKRGYKITEIGILWYHDPNSKVKVFRDSFQMIIDLLKIRWNGIRGKYDPLA
jgi:glycosyltransferase involved in cell wall biosynthesis